MKYGVGLWIFGRLIDRFVPGGYKEGRALDEALGLISKVDLANGVELTYPSDFTRDEAENVKELLMKHNLRVSTLSINLFSDPKWQRGSLTSRDEKIRREAIDLVKEGVDVAERIGAESCTLWLGQDGHDYLFSDHRLKWRLLIEGVKEITGYDPKTKFYLEYKHKEPRTHLIISNVGKVLYLINRVGVDNVGVVVDTGHALMGDENLAESIFLIAESEVPLMLHFNDNYGYWDDDMIVGSINLWRFVELFYALKTIGYDGWYDLDIFPYREDPVKAVEQSLRFLDYVKRKVDEKYDVIHDLVQREDIHGIIEELRRIFLKDY